MSVVLWMILTLFVIAVLSVLSFIAYFIYSLGRPIDVERQAPEDRWYTSIDWKSRDTHEVLNMLDAAVFNLNQWHNRIFRFELNNGSEVVAGGVYVASQPPKPAKLVGTDQKTGKEFCILANMKSQAGYLTFRN